MEVPQERNQVTITGFMTDDFSFSHESNGERFFAATVEVERISGTKDYLPIIVSEKLIDKQCTYVNSPVCIIGQFRSYNLKDAPQHLKLYVFAQDFYIADVCDNINSISITGYLCKPPVYRSTPLGRQIADLLVAIPRLYGKSDYIPCICWGRNAVYISQFDVGTHIEIIGRIQSREYHKMVGDVSETRTAYEVSISDMKTV